MKRRLILLRGSQSETRAEAERLVATLPCASVLWAGGKDASLREVRSTLGGTYQACVIDFHAGFDADLLGQCHGFVLGGGVLIARISGGTPPYPRLAAWGYAASDVTHHFHHRVLKRLEAAASEPVVAEPTPFEPRGTADQDRTIEALAAVHEVRGAAVLTADRGRGKSAALGLWLRDVRGRVAVTAGSEEAVGEVLKFGPQNLCFTGLPAVLDEDFDVIVVDEAAQLPVGTLRELASRHRDATLVFATTTHGYEGTGRGFTLKFVRWLTEQRAVQQLTLEEPIRWAPNDPVEETVFDALLLDAEPFLPPDGVPVHRAVPRTELAEDDDLLRQVFGLLVQAHYRTTPADLHRMLDSPNLAVHATFVNDTVVAATLIAREGAMSSETAAGLASGAMRVVGHALPESFAAHLGRPDLATLSMIRSVRIASHPAARRRGLAGGLVEHVHESYEPELFGTIFAAEPEVVRFRRGLGYEIVRVSASRGSRTGVPSVVMVRPTTPQAAEAVEQLRAEFARDLPDQLALLRADAALRDEVAEELARGLAEPAPLDSARTLEIVRSYAFGPRTLESAVTGIAAWIGPHLHELDSADAALVRARVLEHLSWGETAERAGQPSIPAAMRAVRRAVRSLVESDPFVV